jgi:transcriptional regulator with XRE-family HTH domain
MMDFGERLRVTRQSKEMTQEALADKVGATSAAISDYESGKRLPRLDLLTKLSNALDVSADYLLGRDLHEKDLPDDLRELFQLAVKAEYVADLKDFFRWLAAKRNKLASEPDEFPRKPDEELLALIPEFTPEQIQEILSKFEGDVVQRIAKLTPDQKKVFNEEVAKILYYLDLEKKVKTSGEAAEARTKRG